MNAIPYHARQHGYARPQSLAQLDAVDLACAWQQFLIDTFDADPKAIREAFNVSERTALYWINGEINPRGLHVFHAIRRYNFGLSK